MKFSLGEKMYQKLETKDGSASKPEIEILQRGAEEMSEWLRMLAA